MAEKQSNQQATGQSLNLPPDGSQVEAMTYDDIEYDREPEKVTGTLSTHPCPFEPYVNAYVNGKDVDPYTVKASEK